MSKERIDELAKKIVNTASEWRPKGLTERAIPAINDYIGEWVRDVNTETPSSPTTIPATALQNDMVYRDASGNEFEVETWSDQGQTIRMVPKEGEARVIPKTEQFTFVRNPYAEDVQPDGGRRKRRYRRKTLRRKK